MDNTKAQEIQGESRGNSGDVWTVFRGATPTLDFRKSLFDTKMGPLPVDSEARLKF
jgi:hypothetical protein